MWFKFLVFLILFYTVILSTSECISLESFGTCDDEDEIILLRDTRKIVSFYGYPIETHLVSSEDGYITTLFRIPHGIAPTSENCTTRSPVLFFHGSWSSSRDWFLDEPERTLPFILAENCFDVWIANARGTTYSQGHVSLNSSRDEIYWEFSFDEMGKYDLPATIDFVLIVSGTDTRADGKLDYLCLSMGCTVMFTCLHYHPEYNNKIRKVVALAPAAFMGNLRSPFLWLSARAVQDPVFHTNLSRRLLFNGKLTNNGYDLLRKLIYSLCPVRIWEERTACSTVTDFIGGWSSVKVNETILCRLFSGFPETSSPPTIFHFAQLVLRGRFESFGSIPVPNTGIQGGKPVDPSLNIIGRNNRFPSVSQLQNGTDAQGGIGPQHPHLDPPRVSVPYNLSNTKIPMLFMVGLEDSITSPVDVYRTFNSIGSLKKSFVLIPRGNHLDFILADDSNERVLTPILNYLADKK